MQPALAHAVGADHRQIDFTIGVGVQTALAGDLLGAGLQILMLELRHIAGGDDQAHQTNQVGQGITKTQMILRLRQQSALHAGVAQGIPAPTRTGVDVMEPASKPAVRPISQPKSLPRPSAISSALPTITNPA